MIPRLLARLKSWLGDRPRAPISDQLWNSVLDRHSFLTGLTPPEESALRDLCTRFLAEKEFTAAGGISLTDRICLSVAIQGCLPILQLGLAWYRGWQTIIVYPSEFVVPREVADEDGVVHKYTEVASGEAWGSGPLILSWQDVQMTDDVYNVVIHEFAHKIDMLNGDADALPPLHREMNPEVWQRTMEASYADFCRRVDAAPLFDDANDEYDIDLASILDPYAATHPGEFFAVASETFFTAPHELAAEYPALYAQLQALYRQDPMQRLSALELLPETISTG